MDIYKSIFYILHTAFIICKYEYKQNWHLYSQLHDTPYFWDETFVFGTFLCKLKYYVKPLTFIISYHLQARQSVTWTFNKYSFYWSFINPGLFRRWNYFEVLHFIFWLSCATTICQLSGFFFRNKYITKRELMKRRQNDKTKSWKDEKYNTLICDIICGLFVCCSVACYYFEARNRQHERTQKTEISDLRNNILT